MTLCTVCITLGVRCTASSRGQLLRFCAAIYYSTNNLTFLPARRRARRRTIRVTTTREVHVRTYDEVIKTDGGRNKECMGNMTAKLMIMIKSEIAWVARRRSSLLSTRSFNLLRYVPLGAVTSFCKNVGPILFDSVDDLNTTLLY